LQNLVIQSKHLVVLDYLNAEYVIKNLIKEEQIEKQGIIFHITREIVNNAVLKTIAFEDKEVSYTYYEQVKLYTPAQLIAFFKQLGGHIIAQWSSYEMRKEGNRCILLAETDFF
jgi:methyl coenzyme M reductase beta subunit